ncbi:MAG: S-layer homology domain-containing protein [Oscillospiraceae bacterium]|jgi:hypothetical protein
MHRKGFLRTAALVTALSILLTSFALADVLGELIQGHDTYLGAGMELSKGVYWTGSDYQTENYIEYTPSSTVYPVVVSGSKVCNYGSYASMAKLLENEGKHVIAGINGDYFVVATSEPLGIVVQNGVLLSSDAGHYGVGFTADGQSIFGRPALSLALRIGGTDYGISAVNKTRNAGEAVLYTDAYSSNYKTKNTGEGVDIVCSIDGPLGMSCTRTLTVESINTAGGAQTIPQGKVLLSVSSTVSEALMNAIKSVGEGTQIGLTISCPSGWENVRYALGSLYKLVTDGKVESGLDNTPAPRTAVGKKADGSLVFYTIDGRQSGHSVGVSMTTLAKRMIELGCTEATIMDGGGSTSLNAIYIGDSSASQINRPSDGRQRSVSNYIMLVTDAKPTGRASRLALYPLNTELLLGAKSAFVLKAADDNGYAAALDQYVELGVTGDVGTIDVSGAFTATAAGSGTVTASADGLTGAAVQVRVTATPDSITVKNEGTGKTVSSLAVLTGTTIPLTASAMRNHLALISQDTCYTWAVSGGAIGTISADGTFTAGDCDASGSITVTAGEKTVSIPVTVTNPEKFDDVKKTDWFYDAVKFAGDANIMSGIAERTFAPNQDVTRAMAVMVLYRLENSPEVSAVQSFADVAPDAWYAKAVAWAASKGIVLGDSGRFNPDAAITREQLAAILYRYFGSPATNGTLSSFTDAGSVSSWGVTPLSWAVEAKYISGMTATTIAPGATATRAQFAMILYRMAD